MLKLRPLQLLFVCLLAVAVPVSANNDKQSSLNKSQAAKQAQKVAKGQVLKVEQRNNQYRVKVLQKSGRVVSVNVDKQSGKTSQSNSKD